MKEKEFSADEIYLAPETEIFAQTEIENNSSQHIEIAKKDTRKVSSEIDEIPELRRANKRVYRMSDGHEKAVFYPETLHAFDSNTNRFEKIDNSLIEEEDGRHIRNGFGTFVARFSKEAENDEIFSMESNGHKITVSARKNKKQMNHGSIPRIRKQMLESSNTPERDVISFADIISGSDMEYSVTGNGIKEDIVIKTKSAVYRYPFVLECENLIAEYKESEKNVLFKDPETNQSIFIIPAPFMTDASGAASQSVSYEFKKLSDGKLAFTVTADSQWINEEERVFPVTIDPQILVAGDEYMNTYSWKNGKMFAYSTHTVGTTKNDDGTCNENRMYLSFTIPTLPRNPRIKKAELTVKQASAYSHSGEALKIGLYHVTEAITIGENTPSNSSELIDFVQINPNSNMSYTFDITALVDRVNKGETALSNLVLKMLNENTVCSNYVKLYGGISFTEQKPSISIIYDNSYGVNTSYRTHTHELGRFGQGSVDLQCGNLMFESEDFAWAGNRMPVTIKHLFNSALHGCTYTGNSDIKLSAANFSEMKLGYGFKLNLMQSMVATSFIHEGSSCFGYVYVGENGEETFFKMSDTTKCCDSNSHCYNLYEDINGGDLLYDPEKRTLQQGEDTYLFDAFGRLVQIRDASENCITITYTSNRITSITDGAGREFGFTYNSAGELMSIEAPNIQSISYSYTDGLLTTVSYPDRRTADISYSDNKPHTVTLKNDNGIAIYKVEYTFIGDRLSSVTEYGSNDIIGARSEYCYSASASRTTVTTTEQSDGDEEENVITTTYTFDDDGNIVSEYVYSTDTGKVGGDGEESGINPHSGDGGAGAVSNINNLLTGHNFESLSAWPEMPANCGDLYISNYAHETYAKFGKKVLRMQSYNADCGENGVYQVTNTLPKGQYTFSAYLRVLSAFSGTDAGAFIRVTNAAGNVLGVSEHLVKYDSEYTRLIVPFELAAAQCVQVQILVNGKGTVYADAAQLENNPYANAYNMLENGNFERGTSGWTCSSGVYSI